MRDKIGKILLLLSMLFIGYFFSYSNGQYFSLESDTSNSKRIFYGNFVAKFWGEGYHGSYNYYYYNNFSFPFFPVYNGNDYTCDGPQVNSPFSFLSGYIGTGYASAGNRNLAQNAWFGFDTNFLSVGFQADYYNSSNYCDYRENRSLFKYYGDPVTGLTYYSLADNFIRLFWNDGVGFDDIAVDYAQRFDSNGVYFYSIGDGYLGGIGINNFANKFFGFGNAFSYTQMKSYIPTNTGFYIGFRGVDLKLNNVLNNTWTMNDGFTSTFDVQVGDLVIDLDGLNKNGTNNTRKQIVLSVSDRNIEYTLRDCFGSCYTLNEGYLSFFSGSTLLTEILPRTNQTSIFTITTGQRNSTYKYIMGLFYGGTLPFLDVKLSGSNQFCYYNGSLNYCFGLTDGFDTGTLIEEGLLDGGFLDTDLGAMVANGDAIGSIVAAGLLFGINPGMCAGYTIPANPPTAGIIEDYNLYWLCLALLQHGNLASHSGTTIIYTGSYSGYTYTGTTLSISGVSNIDYIKGFSDNELFLRSCDENFKNSAGISISISSLGILGGTTVGEFDLMPSLSCIYGGYKYAIQQVNSYSSGVFTNFKTIRTGQSYLTQISGVGGPTSSEQFFANLFLNIILSSFALIITFKILFK